MKKAIKIVLNIFAWIILIIAFLTTIIVITSAKNNGVSNFFGYMPMAVQSDSMSPTFNKGDFVLIKDIDDINNLKENDIITFWMMVDGSRIKNTHRIVEVDKSDGNTKFITRGDNTAVNDDPVYPSDIIGKWTNVKIKGLGKVMDFLRTKKGFFICIVIPMLIFFLIELYKFIVTVIEVKKGDSEAIDEEEIKRRAIEEYLAEQKKKEGAATEAAAEAPEDDGNG